MRRYILAGIGLIAAALSFFVGQGAAKAQSNFNASQLYCYVVGPPANWLPCSSTNPVPTSTATTTYVSTAALAANLVVKSTAAKLASFQVAADSTLAGAAWWVMVYDAASAPVDGAVTPAKCYAVPSGTTSASFAFPSPPSFATGIVVGVSTTGCFTKTASTHAFISGDWQ